MRRTVGEAIWAGELCEARGWSDRERGQDCGAAKRAFPGEVWERGGNSRVTKSIG